MDNIEKKLERSGLAIPEILLPREVELRQWAVIACDQFTQDRSYWEKVREAAAASPSTLHLIFPEVFLTDNNRFKRVEDIHRAMRTYLDGDVFSAPKQGFMYLERDTPFSLKRRGLVAAIDLEQYSWLPESRPLIRSTEDTVAERLPPRMEIRRNAPIETQHILLLIDDETDFLFSALEERAKKNSPAYQGELMLDSGSISGWFIDSLDDFAFLAGAFEELANRAAARYPVCHATPDEKPFLFAVGDGNHSLASAKGVWDEYKEGNREQGNVFADSREVPGTRGPACRYALVEIENIYDPAIKFEPIHRVVFGLGFEEALTLLSALPGFSSCALADRGELVRLTADPVQGNRFGLVSGGKYALVETSAGGISTTCLQPLLDKALIANSALSIDYIHGEDELFRLATAPGEPVSGILLPPVQKAGFFQTVARNGPLPRKSFSMGEADEKRFYIECRKLFPYKR